MVGPHEKKFDLVAFVYGADAIGRHTHKVAFLSDFKASETATAYQNFRRHVRKLYRSYRNPFRIELILGWVYRNPSGKYEVHPLAVLKGDDRWLDTVEYFGSYIGDMGSGACHTPVSIGLVDLKNGYRVECTNGTVYITPIKSN